MRMIRVGVIHELPLLYMVLDRVTVRLLSNVDRSINRLGLNTIETGQRIWIAGEND
jgi:hypothetical protein